MSCKSLNFGVLRKLNLRGGLNFGGFMGVNLREFFINSHDFQSENLRNSAQQISSEISQKFRLNLSDFKSIILREFKSLNSRKILLNFSVFKSTILSKFFLNFGDFKSTILREFVGLNSHDFQSTILSKFKGVNSHEIPTPEPKFPHLEQKWTRP